MVVILLWLRMWFLLSIQWRDVGGNCSYIFSSFLYTLFYKGLKCHRLWHFCIEVLVNINSFICGYLYKCAGE